LDQPTIKSAINVANDGDTVLVAPGTYFENNINFKKKAITITSESGPQDTIIDGGKANPVVVFGSGEGRGSVLNGFTLQNGKAFFDFLAGGGILIRNSSPTITNNVITNNMGCFGGGIGISGGSPLIQGNTITNNNGNARSGGACGGGGISVVEAPIVEILDNVISDNMSLFRGDGGGIYLSGAGTPIIKRNIIKGNSAPAGLGGGINLRNEVEALIVQNRITGNQAADGGGIFSIVQNGVIVNNTIADNVSLSGGSGVWAFASNGFQLINNIIVATPGQVGLYCNSISQTSLIRFNNIYSAGGMAYGGSCSDRVGTDGNISADPLFTNPTQGDYHLQQGSPSIDAGDNQAPNLPDKDLDGHPRILDGDGDGTATVDMGVYEFLTPPSFGASLRDGSNGNMLKINSTNCQYLFTRCRGIPLIESHLKPAHTPCLYQLAAGKFDAGISNIRYGEGERIRRHLARQSDRTLALGAPSTSF